MLRKSDESSFESQQVSILTHCNTGSLATAGFGTALGVIRALQSQGHLDRCFATETRPYNQGARLTAYEMVHEGNSGFLWLLDKHLSIIIKLNITNH